MELRDKIPSGFKKTDLGISPQDWCGPVSFDELFTFNGGFSASRDQLSSKGICYLHYGDIHKSKKTFIDVNTEFYEIPKLNIQLNKVAKNMLLGDGDVVFVDASEDNDGVSKYVVVDNVNNIDFISGLHTIVAKSKDNNLEKTFKRYCFQSDSIRKQFLYYAAGTKVTGINKTNIKKVLMVIPPVEEQKAIGIALSDIDELIHSTDELIKKKHMIKQGTMHQLLSGKQQVLGCNSEWDSIKLGELCSITTGKLDANAGYIHYYKGKFNAYQRTYVLSNFTMNIHFIKHYMDMYLKKRIESEVNAGNTPYIKLDTLSEMTIKYPNDIHEQELIAQIISDMEKEIKQLEDKLDKYKEIKLGMMQELLTGRIRLKSSSQVKSTVVEFKSNEKTQYSKVAEDLQEYNGHNENFNEAIIL